MKYLSFLFLLVLILMAGGYFWVNQEVEQKLAQPLILETPDYMTISTGSSLQRVLAQLVAKGWLEPHYSLRLIHRWHPQFLAIKAGTYRITPQMSLYDVLALLCSGKEHQFSITFVEGSRFSDWQTVLARSPNLVQKLSHLSEAEIAQELGLTVSKLEGLLLAETYYFTQGTTDKEILLRAYQKLSTVLEQAWQQRAPNLPLTSAYEALILASIIEKETSIDNERAHIAAVFVNRLNKKMRLQTDPTVIYGMGDNYTGNITKKDLQTATAYNTYVINGLPPTPIAMVGQASIEAALNPIASDDLYFVASGKGGHVFSKTLAEHNRAVRAYLKQLKQSK